jgi:hypothetical protein
MGVLALLTACALGLIPLRRVQAAMRGQVKPSDFRYGESAAVPPAVSIPNRNMMNLLEVPTLFYPVCLMFYVAHRVSATSVILAWGYVVLRALHSTIHLTYNNVFHRLMAFAFSNAALGALWVLFFLTPS